MSNFFSLLEPYLYNVPGFIESLINKPSIFNIAPKKNLWFNWASAVGESYTCITYSAGTTFYFQNQEPLQLPVINIFKNSSVDNIEEQEPLYSITLPAQGVRSAIVIDDREDPFVLLGTFSYPQMGERNESNLFRWNFISGKLEKIYTIAETNSIRTIKRYKKNFTDKIIFSTQEDLILQNNSKIYLVDTDFTIKDNIDNFVQIKTFCENNKYLIGTVWDFSLDNDTIYISIPLSAPDSEKLSNFSIKGRLYYQKINNFLNNKKYIKLNNIIGNKIYKAGFGIDSISTFQTQSTQNSDKIYIYSLSDLFYQTLILLQNSEQYENITKKIMFPNFIQSIREIAQNIDLDGTRIFTVNKNDLYKKTIPKITTILGMAPKNTIDKSKTNNGNNNFLNVYTWQSTSYNNDIYFGTLDVRYPVWQFIVQLIGSQFPQFPQIPQVLLSLPDPIIIFLTEFFLNINFNPREFIKTYFDKQLHFDLLKYNAKGFSPITLNGFSSINPLLPDDGVRNLDIVENEKGKFLLIGSTCYQPNNKAKVYSLKIN